MQMWLNLFAMVGKATLAGTKLDVYVVAYNHSVRIQATKSTSAPKNPEVADKMQVVKSDL